MSTTIRGLFRPALNLVTVAMVSVLFTFAGAASAQPTPPVQVPTVEVPAVPAVEVPEAPVSDEPIKLVAAQRQQMPVGERVMHIAAAQAGDPYQYGASGPNAFDCSGLTSFVYRAAGKSIPRTSSGQRAATIRISREQARRGDLVFFHSGSSVYHVAIFAGDGFVWHASTPGTVVKRAKIWTSAVSFGRVR